MPAISYREFGGGLDRRLSINVQDANKLWTLKNAYITSGKKIQKRPGLRFVADATGSVGLKTLNGVLNVFTLKGSGYTPPAGFGKVELSPYDPAGLDCDLIDVLYCEQFQGYPYVVGLYDVHRVDNPIVPRHSYLDGSSNTLITDANCPHGMSVTKAASRLFCTGGEVVRYCAAGDARDWSASSDAGFLPTGLQQDTKGDCTAVGTFDDALVVFFADGAQVWDVAVDPSANQIRQRMYSVGTQHPHALAAFYSDLVFPSPYGVRSIAVQQNVDRLDESDLGVPIDSLVVPSQAAWEATRGTRRALGAWIPQFGQYWLIYSGEASSTAFVYSFSRSSKLACWSVYEFPVSITALTTLAGKVFVRAGSKVYELDPDARTDDGALIDVDVQMAYQDAKLPGVEKMFYGADFVFSGTALVSYLYDPRDRTRETVAQQITGDTRAATLVPVEVSAAAIAPRFRHEADEDFSVDLATLYFHPLSAQSS